MNNVVFLVFKIFASILLNYFKDIKNISKKYIFI